MPAIVKNTKSRERVRDLWEVFTAEREVNSMLDTVSSECSRPDSKFLEPACGNGNFLSEILKRKLETVHATRASRTDFEFWCVLAVSSVYGADICPENVKETIERLFWDVKGFVSNRRNTMVASDGFWKVLKYVLSKNVVCLNFLELANFTTAYEWVPGSGNFRKSFSMKPFVLGTGLANGEETIKRHYLELCKNG